MTLRGRWALLVALLFLASGCLGPGSETTGEARGNGAPPAPVTPLPVPSATAMLSDDLTAHHHDYWGPRTEVAVFDAPVTLETFPLDGVTYEGCNAVGHALFDFEDDGEDSAPGAPAVNPDTGRADVIFPGTSRIRVVVDWTESDPAGQQSVPGLALRYKPANQRLAQTDTVEGLRGSACGIIVPQGEAFHLPVKPLQFDPAHQTSLSRWSFELWSFAAPQGTLPAQAPSIALGQVRVTMSALYGGDTLLDPPHPDFFGASDTLALGTAEGHADFSVIAEPDLPQGLPRLVSSPFGYQTFPSLTEITLPRGSIAPLGMERMEVVACVQYAGAVPDNALRQQGLAFHGADVPEYTLLEPVGETDGCPLYRIDDPQGLKADSPYETVSQWAFRIVPMLNDAPDQGWFEGDYRLTFTAYRNVT